MGNILMRKIGVFNSGAIISYCLLCLLLLVTSVFADGEEKPSISIGTTTNGRLENGRQLPSSGDNFTAFSYLATVLGRNTVHSKVQDVVLDAYKLIYEKHPALRYVYGEASLSEGGKMRPHRTHQNGLSVDFMVPVRNDDGEVSTIPTWAWNKWGYDVEFNELGKSDGLTIDFEAINIHLLALRDACARHGVKLQRVIFAPDLRDDLFKAKQGDKVRRLITFMKGKAWVRHDEHYHVDFEVK